MRSPRWDGETPQGEFRPTSNFGRKLNAVASSAGNGRLFEVGRWAQASGAPETRPQPDLKDAFPISNFRRGSTFDEALLLMP